MKAVILAGGLRSGHEVEGLALPRALWPFPREPLISHVIGFLRVAGVRDIAICANGKTKLIAAELSKQPQPWDDLHYSEDAFPRGPAGCLRDLTDWLGDEPFLSIQGTGHYSFDLNPLVAQHHRTHAAITIAARVSGVDAESLEPAGAYMVNPSVLELVPAVGFQDIKEQLIPKAQSVGQLVDCHVLRGQALLVHSERHYLAALEHGIRQNKPASDQYRVVAPDVFVHHEASVASTARLRGPVWVESGAVIGDRAVIVGPALVGRQARVETGALLHRVALLEGSCVAADAELFARVVGPRNVVKKAAPARSRRPDASDRPSVGTVSQWLESLAWPRPRRVVANRA